MTELQQSEGTIHLERFYLKDVSFEAPNSPQIHDLQWSPEIKVEIQCRNTVIKDNRHEVVVQVTLTTTNKEKTAFVAEIQQAGLFVISGLSKPQNDQVLATFCPNMLFPYLREAVDNLVIKGGFPPVALAPMNFDAIYAQAQRQQQQEQQRQQQQLEKNNKNRITH